MNTSRSQMRVAMYYNNRDIRIEQQARPSIGAKEALLEVHASGICGSDVLEWYRRDKAPLVLGHEIAGEIVELGAEVAHLRLGQRVAAAHHVPCNTCRLCLGGHDTMCDTLRTTTFDPGGFAEFVRLPAINVDRGVFPLPDTMSYEEGTFAEPLGCVIRGQRQAGFAPGQRVLVIGAGIAGILHIALARALGAERIVAVDINPSRLSLARRFGADLALHADEDLPAALRQAFRGWLAERIVVATGAKRALHQALECTERGAVVLLFASTDEDVSFPLDVNRVFWRRDLTITTSYAANRQDHLLALSLIDSQRIPVADMITHRLPLEHSGEGFRLVANAEDSLKVILQPKATQS